MPNLKGKEYPYTKQGIDRFKRDAKGTSDYPTRRELKKYYRKERHSTMNTKQKIQDVGSRAVSGVKKVYSRIIK